MELTFTQLRILYEALDGSSVPELLRASRSYGARGGAIDWPEIPLDEARRALLDLLRVDCVALYDHSGEVVPAELAVRVVEDDASWTYPTSDQNHYEIGVTDEGEKTYTNNLSRFSPHGPDKG